MSAGGPEEYCRALWPRLAASMAYLSGDVGAGEDLAQEALTRAWARWGRVSRLDSPDAWTYRVAVNLARSRHRRRQAEQRALARIGESTSVVDAQAADAIAVRDAVGALPERMRAALVLRNFADLPVDEVAEILDCAPGTVKSLTSQAIDHRTRRPRHRVRVRGGRNRQLYGPCPDAGSTGAPQRVLTS